MEILHQLKNLNRDQQGVILLSFSSTEVSAALSWWNAGVEVNRGHFMPWELTDRCLVLRALIINNVLRDRA